MVDPKPRCPTVGRDPIGLDVLEPLLADLLHALGWVAAQALFLVQPLLTGWVDESAVGQAIHRLERAWSSAERQQE